MISDKMGPEKFVEFLRAFTEQWKGRSPTVDDLEAALDDWTDTNWDNFFGIWIHGKTLPRLSVRYATEKMGRSAWSLLVEVTQERPLSIQLPIRVSTDSAHVDLTIDLPVMGGVTKHELSEEPVSLVVNPNHRLLLGEVEVTKVQYTSIRRPEAQRGSWFQK
jgi:aminopeptidase N